MLDDESELAVLASATLCELADESVLPEELERLLVLLLERELLELSELVLEDDRLLSELRLDSEDVLDDDRLLELERLLVLDDDSELDDESDEVLLEDRLDVLELDRLDELLSSSRPAPNQNCSSIETSRGARLRFDRE